MMAWSISSEERKHLEEVFLGMDVRRRCSLAMKQRLQKTSMVMRSPLPQEARPCLKVPDGATPAAEGSRYLAHLHAYSLLQPIMRRLTLRVS